MEEANNMFTLMRQGNIKQLIDCLFVCLFVLRLNVPVNNFSVMSGRSQLFLGLSSTVGS